MRVSRLLSPVLGLCAGVTCLTPTVPAQCDDVDGDGVPPGEVLSSRFTDKTNLVWDVPPDPRAPAVNLAHDTIRSSDATTLGTGAVGVESNGGPDTFASDSENPLAGVVFYYLVRAENDCPDGRGTLGAGGGGVERAGREC